MKKKSKRLASLLLVTCILVALFSFGASAKTSTGTKNGIRYTATMNFDRRYMEVIFQGNPSSTLKFDGYARYSLGTSQGSVECDRTYTGTSTGRTVNPPSDSLQFYYGLEQYYINGSYVTTHVESLPKL